MKKSRIFLVATLALGIAGAVAAKAHTASVKYNYFNSLGSCIEGTFPTDPCPFGVNFDCTINLGGSTVQLYTDLSTCTFKDKIKRAG
jgi:hypothetical protein